jgi:hypothetical protein
MTHSFEDFSTAISSDTFNARYVNRAKFIHDHTGGWSLTFSESEKSLHSLTIPQLPTIARKAGVEGVFLAPVNASTESE